MTEEEKAFLVSLTEAMNVNVVAIRRMNDVLQGMAMAMERYAFPQRTLQDGPITTDPIGQYMDDRPKSSRFGCRRGPSCTLAINDPIHTDSRNPKYHPFSV